MSIRKKLLLGISGVLAVGLLLLGGFWLAHLMQPNNNPVPASIAPQVSFIPLVIPANIKSITTSDYKVSTVEDGTHILTYIMHVANADVTVSEYPQPSQFTDVPDFKSKFLDDVIQQTASLSTSSGTIVLGQMAKQQNKQFAVMLEHGLVVFMTPSESIGQDQWQAIGDTLDTIKPSS